MILHTAGGDHTYQVEIAETLQEKARGLMFRRSLPQDQGMIFVYDTPRVMTMWMRNTYIPLDMVFIAENGTVLNIVAETEPFSTDIISSSGKALAVLEINGGAAARIGLKPGDRVAFPGLGQAPDTENKGSGLW